MAKGFDDLQVYRLAEEIADEIWRMAKGWDRAAWNTVGIQIVRAGDSIGANIAEGYGRGTYADNKRFVRIARGSLYEVRHHLRRAYRRGFITKGTEAKLASMIKELGPRLNAYLRSIGPNDQ